MSANVAMGQVAGAHVMAQLALLPVDDDGEAPLATHVAVTDGDWFDPATWGGSVPGQGAIVHIPQGLRVAYEGASDADIFLVRVDGSLTLSANNGVATVLSVDTIITAPGSTLNIHANRATDGTVDIVFTEANQADIPAAFHDSSAGDGVLGRTSWDPQQLSLGLVASGTVDVRGQETLGHMQLDTGPAAGATTLRFDAGTPLSETWSVGDKLVVGGTSYEGRGGPGNTLISQDEVRTITSIAVVGGQMIVTLDQPLTYDHRGPLNPQTGAELTSFVANLSRNVTFSSAVADMDGDGLMDRAVSVGDAKAPGEHYTTERGHVMFMHNDDVTVADSAFYGLGRTDKSVPLDDFQLKAADGSTHRIYEDTNGNGVYDEGIDTALKTAPEDVENMRGRYALHIHEAGTDGGHDGHGDGMAASGEDAPCPETGDLVCRCSSDIDADGDGNPDCDTTHHGGVQIVGNVVWGSPGWGFVQHSSVADLIDNVAFDVAGSAFVAESGDEVGSWSHNAAFSTYGGRADFGTDDSDDFNEDGGFEGNGFYLKSRLIEADDNAAVSSARAGFFWHGNGINLRDTDADWLGELEAIAKGRDGVATEDVPIRNFEGNTVIAAYEGIRLITNPTDSVRKFNDAWSHLKDFTAWEVDESGVSITYSSKYIFENFLIIGTDDKMSPQGQQASAGFFFKASVADITIVDSHVENFLNAYTDWVQVGDRQEYRRGYWDPKDPASLINTWGMEHYKGIGTELGIDNPIYNLWNINLVDVSWANIDAASKIRVPKINFTDDQGKTTSYSAHKLFNTHNNSTADDPAADAPISIELVDDSASGGLVALWREDIANDPNGRAQLAENIPLAYRDGAFLSQIHWANGTLSKRSSYMDYVPGITDDIWSGTVLEFAKTDSLGRQVFAYDDFAPMNQAGATRAVTTNERIVFSREDIDAVLRSDGYYSLDGASDLKFVELSMLFTDRLTGRMETRAFLVALDLAWEVPDAASFLGIYHARPESVIAKSYGVFENGVLLDEVAPVVPQFDQVLIWTPDGDVPLLSPASDAARAGLSGSSGAVFYGGQTGGGAGDDVLIGSAAKDSFSGGAGKDLIIGDGGDDSLAGDAGDDDLRGGNGDDILYGGSENDVLIGGNGNDRLYGGTGRDQLNGGQGNDILDGGAGDDVLVGHGGINILTGGAGADRFVYGGWSHEDRITDFEVGMDALDFLVQGLGFGDLRITQTGDDTRIEYRGTLGENVILLEGIDIADVTADIFHFT